MQPEQSALIDIEIVPAAPSPASAVAGATDATPTGGDQDVRPDRRRS
ncbi:MAG: hypothetical protein AB7G13_15620 [Lautropia sp.]